MIVYTILYNRRRSIEINISLRAKRRFKIIHYIFGVVVKRYMMSLYGISRKPRVFCEMRNYEDEVHR